MAPHRDGDTVGGQLVAGVAPPDDRDELRSSIDIHRFRHDDETPKSFATWATEVSDTKALPDLDRIFTSQEHCEGIGPRKGPS